LLTNYFALAGNTGELAKRTENTAQRKLLATCTGATSKEGACLDEIV
tara:strand:+ start:1056 stop:1196 length:141 start_codon:yes stop_codon:yes gene_type:complete